MKKHLALILGVAFLSTSAFATKARLIALGETESAGSLFFSDNRNMFLNAAYINEYKDFLTLELGSEGQTATKKDSDTQPYAEGGVIKSFGNFVGGIYLGGESASVFEARQYLRLADGANAKTHQDNQIDFFFGGDAGVKWGANLSYSKTDDDANNMDQSSLSSRLGVIAEKFEAFANVAWINKAEEDGFGAAGKDKFKGKLGFELGGNYNLGNNLKAFAYWKHAKFETDTVTSAGTIAIGSGPAYTGNADFVLNKYRIGAGHDYAVSSKARILSKLEYIKNSRKVETKDGDADLSNYSIPVSVALEYDASSWLTLRGSVTQSLIGKANNDYDAGLLPLVNPAVLADLPAKERTLNSTTNVNTGATLKFGNLAFDGLVGTGTATGGTVDSKSEQGLLTLDNLMSRVSMTYRF